MLKRLLLALFLLLLALAALSCAPSAQFQGTDLGATPAPDFHLTDQTGHAVALSDLRGKVVVLTFVYTQCTDVCPLIAAKLGQVYDQLGSSGSQVQFVAVSLDPEGDTPTAIAAFSARNNMQGRWLYLNGPSDQLSAVWSAYYLDVEPATPPSTQVGHTTRIIVIDRQGKQRVNLDPDFQPADLLQDIKIVQAS